MFGYFGKAAVLCLLMTVIMLAQASGRNVSASDNQDLKRVFSDAVRAVGTKEAISKIKSIDARADCDGPHGKYATYIQSAIGGSVYFQQEYSYRPNPRKMTIVRDLGWQFGVPNAGPEILSPFQKLVVRLHEYQRLAYDFENSFSDFELKGEGNFNGAPHHKVAAKTMIGTPAILYFDKETRLLSGYVLPASDPNESVTNIFKRWRVIDGVKVPVLITAYDSAGVWTLDFKSVEFNKPVGKKFEIPPLVGDLAELIRLHEQAKTAHLTYNPELFVSMFGENLTQIQSGEVLVRNRETHLARFQKYFESYKFSEWENIVPPVIKISNDGTLATVQVQKRVRGTYTDEKDKIHEDLTIFAWLEVWEKINGEWKVVTVASTRK